MRTIEFTGIFLCVKLPFYIIWKTLKDDQHIISINFSQQKYNKISEIVC